MFYVSCGHFLCFSRETLHIVSTLCIIVAEDTHTGTHTHINTSTESCRAVNVSLHSVYLLINLIDCGLCVCVFVRACACSRHKLSKQHRRTDIKQFNSSDWFLVFWSRASQSINLNILLVLVLCIGFPFPFFIFPFRYSAHIETIAPSNQSRRGHSLIVSLSKSHAQWVCRETTSPSPVTFESRFLLAKWHWHVTIH